MTTEPMLQTSTAEEDPRRTPAYVVRFSLWARLTHGVLALSVFGLILTGMPLRYASAFWAKPLMRMWGGAETAGDIHRAFALGFFAAAAMHIVGLSAATIRRRLGPITGPDSILLRLQDMRHVAQNVRFLRDRGPHPDFGRFTYWEKFDYFAEIWGLLVIGLSGLVMWFPEPASRVLPGWAVNAALIFHSYEALLAMGFLFAIHFFNTHLRPHVFPLDPSIFTGRVSLEEIRRDRPGWYERLMLSGDLERLRHDERPIPPVARIAGIGLLSLGLIVLLVVMATAIAELINSVADAVRSL